MVFGSTQASWDSIAVGGVAKHTVVVRPVPGAAGVAFGPAKVTYVTSEDSPAPQVCSSGGVLFCPAPSLPCSYSPLARPGCLLEHPAGRCARLQRPVPARLWHAHGWLRLCCTSPAPAPPASRTNALDPHQSIQLEWGVFTAICVTLVVFPYMAWSKSVAKYGKSD